MLRLKMLQQAVRPDTASHATPSQLKYAPNARRRVGRLDACERYDGQLRDDAAWNHSGGNSGSIAVAPSPT
jgi:hypothetical protein